MTKDKYPPGWDKARVERVLRHYEAQTEEEAVAEDEYALNAGTGRTVMEIPNELLPEVRELLARHSAA